MEKSIFQIINHKLTYFHFEKNKNFQKKGTISLDVKGDTQISKDKQKNIAIVTFTLSLFKDFPIDEVPFFTELQMEGTFKWVAEVKEEHLKELLHMNAPAILLSYMRPFISQVTTYAGYPPLILPLMDFTKKKT